MQRLTRAVVLKQYSEDYDLSVGPANLPLLQPNQVLVRLEYASVSATDIRFLQGHCPVVRALPAVPGFEASGTVVETGSRLKNWRFQGKRVGVFALDSGLPGAWAEYAVVQSRHCFLLNDTITFEQAAGLFQTPLTVCMFEEAIGKGKGVIQTGGCSAVAKTLLRVCNYKALACVCVISSPEEAASLTELGARYILLGSDPDFQAKAASLCAELKVTVAFDCQGGGVAGQVFNAMQPGGVLYTYEETNSVPTISHISPSALIFDKKKIMGLNLFVWFEGKYALQKVQICSHIQQYYFMYRQEVVGVYPIHEVRSALQRAREVGRLGKVLMQLRETPVIKLPSETAKVSKEEAKETIERDNPAFELNKDLQAEYYSASKAVRTVEALLGSDDAEEVEITAHDLSLSSKP